MTLCSLKIARNLFLPIIKFDSLFTIFIYTIFGLDFTNQHLFNLHVKQSVNLIIEHKIITMLGQCDTTVASDLPTHTHPTQSLHLHL